MADPIELPPWYQMFRQDMAEMEQRITARFNTLTDDIERRVTVEAFDAEKRFQNERSRLTDQKIAADIKAAMGAIELEKTERVAALAKEADDRATAIREEQKDREELEASLTKSENERRSQRRWTIGMFVTVGGIVLSSLAVVIAAEVPKWFG